MPSVLSPSYSFTDIPRLTRALQRGEDGAYAWLHARWSSRINRYCFAVAAGDDALAADIAQSVWLRVVRHMRPLKDESALWNWLARAARHAAIDLNRRKRRYLGLLSRFADVWMHPFKADGAHDSTISPDDALLAALDASLQVLTGEERDLITRRYFSADSLETIALRHSLTVRAVEGRLARLRKRLRTLIAQELNSAN